jgi:hypothetical protein
MSDETGMDKVLREFLESVTAVLRQHAERLERLTEGFARMEQNQAIEHLNMKEIGEMVNNHTAILSALDDAVRQRMGDPPIETPPEAVN